MTLVPQVVDAINIPVVAAGGIADGRGVAAALMLGAVGVQVGTRFLVADECTVSEEYKERVLKAGDISTILQLATTDIDVTKNDAKTIWDKLQKYLPLYTLFQADRKNTDGDSEVQDPLKEAVKEILADGSLTDTFLLPVHLREVSLLP